jgi:hypothetical protein
MRTTAQESLQDWWANTKQSRSRKSPDLLRGEIKGGGTLPQPHGSGADLQFHSARYERMCRGRIASGPVSPSTQTAGRYAPGMTKLRAVAHLAWVKVDGQLIDTAFRQENRFRLAPDRIRIPVIQVPLQIRLRTRPKSTARTFRGGMAAHRGMELFEN